ncbi:hypothetical protein EDD15DRAFT_2370602 [Pisolithus albus]|nr:hypothetical protein EDD15DRAFT_2370602 [Pisolithus albus]
MPAIVTLADETARLIKRTPYDDLRRRISHLERDLEETSYDLRRALWKIDDLQREPTPTIPTPTMVEQAARDFECARVASLGGRTYSSNAEASSSRLPPPPAPQPSSSSRGKVQAKPASQVEPVVSRKGKAKQLEDDTHQAAPDYEFTAMEEDTSAQQCYDDDIPMVVDTASQGTLFPEFTGEENPYRVRVLGQGRDGVRSILFVRINDNLYAYDDERLGAALANIRQGTPPPVPLRRGNLVASVTRWDRGIMGPIRLINTAEEIRKLYAEAYEEPEENAPCIRRAQELITYINLWKECRLVTNEVMNLALKEWRPPVWASQKVRQRREVLRDKERARREGEALALQPVGGQPALQQRIGGQPAAPLPEMGQRPIVPLRDRLMVENPGVPQAPAHQERPPPRGRVFNPRGGGRTSGKKGKGGIPELPREAPSLEAPVADWVKFIHEYQNGYGGSDESSELSRMFPGVLGVSERPDDDEWEIIPRGSYDRMVWFWELVRLLAAKGRYRALLDCAEVAPHDGTRVPWEGEFTRSAGMADIAAYLAANGITPHDADDALVWARRAGREYITHAVDNGGERDPNVRAALDLLRVAINDPPVLKENRSKEWVERQARTLGIATERIAAYEARTVSDAELPIIRDFCSAAVIYDLPNYLGVEGRISQERTPEQNDEPEEGEMRDEPAPM